MQAARGPTLKFKYRSFFNPRNSYLLFMFGKPYLLIMLQPVLKAYGLNPETHTIESFGSGLINRTWKISGPDGQYVLQHINTNIFKQPQAIADNLQLLDTYLKQYAPGYLFAAPLPAVDGQYLVFDNDACFRLLPFIAGSHSVDFLTEPAQAIEAAAQFAKFTGLLNDFDVTQLKYTLPDFHNLDLRISQFQQAVANADQQRIIEAQTEIDLVNRYINIADTYRNIVQNKEIPLRVIHHDTKINNVLFDADDKGLAVVDLDTVMPGYYISDAGDMMRTYLSEANEEEQDLSKIIVREDFFAAIYKGYMSKIGDVLTDREKELFIYSGKFMIYMQAVRFLTDFLKGDVYYQTKYPGHNLMRAKNQLCLLDKYLSAEQAFQQMINDLSI